MHMAKQKQTHRYREQSSDYQCGVESRERQTTGSRLRGTKYKIDKQ